MNKTADELRSTILSELKDLTDDQLKEFSEKLNALRTERSDPDRIPTA